MSSLPFKGFGGEFVRLHIQLCIGGEFVIWDSLVLVTFDVDAGELACPLLEEEPSLEENIRVSTSDLVFVECFMGHDLLSPR